MGQVRTPECERIDEELRAMCGSGGGETQVDVKTVKDTYSEDYMVWLTVDDTVHPIRITIDEYADGSWRENMRQAIELLRGA